MYKHSKIFINRRGWGGLHKKHLLEVKTKITLLRSTFNTRLIHRANWFLLIQMCVLFLQISSYSELQDIYDPEKDDLRDVARDNACCVPVFEANVRNVTVRQLRT